jgi:hypothetical protein
VARKACRRGAGSLGREANVRTPDVVEIEVSPARRYACFVWQAILPAGGLSGRRAGWKARLQPGLAATQQRCGPTQFPRPPNLQGRLQDFRSSECRTPPSGERWY